MAATAMKHYLGIFINSILAGFCMVIGATVLLKLQDCKPLGTFLFGYGLFSVITFKFWLYTGKIGAFLDNSYMYLIDLVLCLVGNFIGDFLLAIIVRQTALAESVLIPKSKGLVAGKQSQHPMSIFFLSFMCGIMIYLAVNGYKKHEFGTGKAAFNFLAIMIFILSGYEHCIANGVYYIYAHSYDAKSFLYVGIMVLGNSLGAICFDGLMKIADWGMAEEVKKKDDVEANEDEAKSPKMESMQLMNDKLN